MKQENDEMKKNLAFVKENFDELLNLHRNKYVLISNQVVINSFDTYEAAVEEGVRLYGLEEKFLVRYISESTPVNFVVSAKI